MVMNVSQKLHHVGGVGIVVEQRVVQPESLRPRRAGKGCHRGDPVVPSPGMLDGRLSHGSPYTPPQWLQQIAAFVEKNQASLPFEALFLTAAILRGASGRWLARYVRGHVAPVSGDSNRACATAYRHSPRGTRRQNVAESNPAPLDKSNHKACSPSSVCPASVLPKVDRTADETASLSVRNVAEDRETCDRQVSRRPSTAKRMTHCNRSIQPLPSAISPAQKAGLLSFDELQALRECRMVSCMPAYRWLTYFPLTT